jgi:hypothetical protein
MQFETGEQVGSLSCGVLFYTNQFVMCWHGVCFAIHVAFFGRGPMEKKLWSKLNNLFGALASAEKGDFDTVRDLLTEREQRDETKTRRPFPGRDAEFGSQETK